MASLNDISPSAQEHSHINAAADQPTPPPPPHFPNLQTGSTVPPIDPPVIEQHEDGNPQTTFSPTSHYPSPAPPPINAIIPSGYSITHAHAPYGEPLSPTPPLFVPPVQSFPPPPITTHSQPQQASVPALSPSNSQSAPIPGVNTNPALNEDATQAYHTQNTSFFGDLDDLTSHLKQIPGSGNTSGGPGPPPGDKSVPIVFLPGFLGWGAPILHVYNYFGGLVSLAQDLAGRGWPVIVPMVGAISSNWERACELYAQLSHGSFDGNTFDIIVDYGYPPPESGIVYVNDSPPKRRQAACFNLASSWRWGPEHPVHFIAHSQGGNTVRYLIHLLESGESIGNSSYFGEKKLGWVKSLVTLATPFNGTSIIDVLDQLGDAEDKLMDNAVAASSWAKPDSRIFDFMLDHRGLRPPEDGTPEAENFLLYLEKVKGPDGVLTQWRKSKFNGLYDNSILGVANLNKIIGAPSQDVYYFTLSFAATIQVPSYGIINEDILGLVKLNENVEKFTNLFSRLGFNWGSGASQPVPTIVNEAATTTTTTTTVATTQVASATQPTHGISSSWVSHIPSKRAKKLVGILKSSSSSSVHSSSSTSSPTPAQPPIEPLAQPMTNSQETRTLFAHTTLSTFFASLQDIAKWSLNTINSRLPVSVPKLPVPGTTIPRADMFPPFKLTAYGMGAYELSAAQRTAIAAECGPTKDSEWHEHDGVVNTVSMRGPWGCGNRIVRVEEVIGKWTATMGFQGVARRREDIRGVWVDLGKSTYMDHADCIGTGVDPVVIIEVVELYRRIGELLELL